MRILGVRFKNLNSLVGEWQVDFTHPAYASDGIFAITGPTGAGKTTIMDAVCLALYGSTPRLGKITKGGNEIMSRQTGECFAQVTFETGKGHYRCHWSQHRARKKPDGELQQARHEIVDADSDRVMESKINEVGEFIEKVTGMDFGRFTRSMLLAQGGFAVFLQASPNERSPILEQITGTEIYSRISVQVHERRAAELEKLDLLQAELKGIHVLGEDEEQELQTGLKEKQQQETELAGKMKEMAKALAWIGGMAALEKELGELEKKQQAFEERQQGFAPEAKKLEKAHKALGLDGDYRSLAALRELQASETAELHGTLAILPEQEKAGVASLAARVAAEDLVRVVQTRQMSEGAVIKKVRDFDVRLDEQIKRLTEKDKAIREIEKQAKGYRSRVQSTEQELKEVRAALEMIQEYRTGHAADAGLVTNLSAIERGFAGLRDMEAKHAKAFEELSRVAGNKESSLGECRRTESDHEKARLAFEKTQNDLNKLSGEITAILQGRDIGQWRMEMDTMKDRERLLVQTGETRERIDRISKAVDGLKTDKERLIARHAGILEEVKSCSDQKTLLEKGIAALETQVALLSRIRDLEEERKRLEDGQPCPLCGATEHPYAEENLPALNDAEADLKKKKDEFKDVSQRLNGLEAGRVKTAAEIEHIEKEMAEKKTALDTDQEQCVHALARLKIEVSQSESSGRIHEEIAGVQATISETSKTVALAEEKGRREKSVQAALEKTRKFSDKMDKALQEARHKLETAGLDHERLRKEGAALVEEMETARAAVLRDVGPYGIGRIPPEGLDVLLQALTGRKAAWQAAEVEQTAREKKIDELKALIEKNQALLGNLEEDLVLRRRDRDGLKGEFESLSASRRELFGEKNADEEEKRLAAVVDQVNGMLETAREGYGRIEKEIGTLKEKIASLQAKTGQRAREMAQAEQQWLERVKNAGFADEAGFLSSCLTEDEREHLAEKERNLLREKTELDARRQDRSDALVVERQKNLTDQSAATLEENARTGEVELKQLGLNIGGIVKSLSDNESQKKNQQERLKNIGFQKREWARWDDLHQLIGSAVDKVDDH